MAPDGALCGSQRGGRLARRVCWASSGFVLACFLGGSRLMPQLYSTASTSSLQEVTNAALLNELNRRGLPGVALQPRVAFGPNSVSLSADEDSNALSSTLEALAAGVDTTAPSQTGVQPRSSDEHPHTIWSSTTGSFASVSLWPGRAQSSSNTLHSSAKGSSVENSGQLKNFAKSSSDEEGKRLLWAEGARLLGEKGLQHLVVTSRQVQLDSLVVFGPKGDAGMDLIMKEASDEYVLWSANLTDGDVYLDIGGHVGLPVLIALAHQPKLRVVCIEALPENYFYIRWNLLANGWGAKVGKEVVVLNRAVSNVSGRMIQVHYMPEATTSSGSFKDDRKFAGSVMHRVETISFSNISAQYAFGRVALLKLDCEGCEWSAVASLSEQEFEDLFSGRVVGELHMIPDCRKRGWKRAGPWCDDKFASRTCGGRQSHACCISYQRLCVLRQVMVDSCASMSKLFEFNGIKC